MTQPPAVLPWQPANETEQTLAGALSRGDRREFFRVLVNSDLYLPAFAADRSGTGPQHFLTVDIFDQPHLPVFTSVPALLAALGNQVDAYTVTTYFELRRKWPDPAWRLAVNPGAPIDAYVTIEAVQDAALGDVDVPTAAEIVTGAEQEMRARPGGTGPGDGLRAAVDRGDVDGYVHALLDTEVILPVTAPAEPQQVLQPDFPWRPVEAPRIGAGDADRDDQREPCPTIEVFTSAATFQAGYPGTGPSVTVPLPAVIAAWPGEEYQLAIDPRTDLAVTLSGDHVAALVLWLGDEGEPAPPGGPLAIGAGHEPAAGTPSGDVPPGRSIPGSPIPGGPIPGGLGFSDTMPGTADTGFPPASPSPWSTLR